MPYFTTYFGNPHSRTHVYGWESEAAIELARKVNIIYNLNLIKLHSLKIICNKMIIKYFIFKSK